MNAQEQAQFRWNHVAKPLNSLGKLEQLVVQIAGIQQTADVCINKRCVLICCGDHGVVAEGVSQSGSEVTALVAQSIVAGTANINLMASVSGTDVYALDFGMVTPVMGTVDCRIAAGTRNMAREPAMTRAQAEQAVQAGIDAVARMKARGYQLIATGTQPPPLPWHARSCAVRRRISPGAARVCRTRACSAKRLPFSAP